MNFTREPIIETVITPREGCNLVLRSSKGIHQEDYVVEAVEVVSFGRSFFFRSIEGAKTFLLPVSDYELLETKEVRIALKNATLDRSIKISGGREAASRAPRENVEGKDDSVSVDRVDPSIVRPPERKRDNKRRRGRRGRDRNDSIPREAQEFQVDQEDSSSPHSASKSVPEQAIATEQKAPSFISKLFPPPSTLIRDTISRYKTVDPSVEDLSSMTSTESAIFEEHVSFEEETSPKPDHLPSFEDEEE